MKKMLALAMGLLLVALPLAGCSTAKTPPTPSGEPVASGDTVPTVKEVAIVTPYLSSTTTKQMVDVLEKDMADRGWKPTTYDTNNDFSALASRMEDVITAKVDAIVIVSADPSLIADQVKAADTAGIPVFACDSGFIDGITVNATSDNVQMSTIITDYLFEKMGYKGNLVVLTHRPHPGILKRSATLDAKIAENPDIKLVTEQHVEVPNPIDNARTSLENILLANSGDGAITAVWCAWDEAAIGAVQAIEDAKRSGIIVTGIDGNAQAKELIDNGDVLVATVEQNFAGMAKIVVEEMAKQFNGETITRGEQYAPASLYTGQ